MVPTADTTSETANPALVASPIDAQGAFPSQFSLLAFNATLWGPAEVPQVERDQLSDKRASLYKIRLAHAQLPDLTQIQSHARLRLLAVSLGDAAEAEAAHIAIEQWLGALPGTRGPGNEPPSQLFVLLSSHALTVPCWGRLPQPHQRILETLTKRFAESNDRLLIVSGGPHLAAVRELSVDHKVIGHEVVAPGRTRARFPAFARRLEGARELVCRDDDQALKSVSLGRDTGGGSVELHFCLPSSDKDEPEVRVLFHLADSMRNQQLSELLQCQEQHPEASRRPTAPSSPPSPVSIADHPEFALDPVRNGARLELRSQPGRSEDLVRRCAHLQGPDLVNALIKAERPRLLARRARRSALAAARAQNAGNDVPAAPARPSAKADSDALEIHGLALSGGGIRSGTVSLGFMRELQTKAGLARYDYVSSVSGGSYANGYLQVMTSTSLLTLMGRETAPDQMLTDAFSERSMEVLHGKGRYLALGSGFKGGFNLFRLLTSFTTSLLQHWLWLVSLVIALGYLGQRFADRIDQGLGWLAAAALVSVLMRLVVNHDWGRLRSRVQRVLDAALNRGETVLLLALLALGTMRLVQGAPLLLKSAVRGAPAEAFIQDYGVYVTLVVLAVLTVTSSPNCTSLHRYYSARLADAFLVLKDGKTLREKLGLFSKLFHHLVPLGALDRHDTYGPYPLFNGCVNLLGDDPAFAGQQTGDYFVFSPAFCGSKLTGYARTHGGAQYGRVTLAEAVTCSGAAVSPFQGRSMPSAISLLLWLFNLRTDLWLPNPSRPRGKRLRKLLDDRRIPFGPLQQLRALFGKADTDSRFINVSDGAFIDSLGVYELLRRRCRVIVAVDATLDPHYDFHTLRNLVQRAQQELGVKISFSPEQRPTVRIKPDLSNGLSNHCVAHGTITWPMAENRRPSQFFYVKTAVLREEPKEGARSADASRAYATYHAAFPQESTGDQFFDRIQWQAYHDLGRRMARELLDDPCWKVLAAESDPNAQGVSAVAQAEPACACATSRAATDAPR